MIKKYSLVVVACLCFVFSGFGQGSETFENIPANSSSYSAITWTGDNGVTWNATSARTDQSLTLRAICTNNNGTVTSPTYTGGMGTLSFNYVRAFTGTKARSIEVWVNGVQRGGTITVSSTSDVVANYSSDLNITGSVTLELRTSGSQIKIDDVSWTAYSPSDPNLAITGTPTNHGTLCPSTSATTRTYTITNSGTIAAAGITVVSDDAQFVVSALSSTTIAASGTATYKVTFTPASAGPKTATITVASTTATSNSPTSSLTGTGAAVVNQTVSSTPATVITANTATLNGNVTVLGTCPNTIEKGFVYSQTSLNGNPFVGGVDVTKTTVAGLTTGTFNLPIAGLNNGTNYTFKPYVYNGTTYTYGGIRNFTTLNTADFCNLQFPANGTITAGNLFNVYARIYEPGMTTVAGANPAITAWIGYSTTNNNPNTWTDWVPATLNAEYGDDDEYRADIGAGITAGGTYYYASRFQINTGPYTYGGISPPSGGNFWNGAAYISGVLTVNPDQVDFCNVDYPKMGTVELGNTFNVYAQGYEPGLTNALPAQAPGLNAWIGYNSIGIDYMPEETTGWIWVPATYDSDSGNNDQYVANLGAVIPAAGTYYYASRWQLNGSDFSYGGIASDNVGNFWDATNNSGVLTITAPIPCHEEDFSGLSSVTTTYTTRTWTGTGGNWNATDAREDQEITPGNKAITIKNGILTSPSFNDGIGSLTVTTQLIFGTVSGTFNLKINGVTKGTIPYSTTAQTITILGINILNDVIITIENNSIPANRVAFDNLSWTCYDCPIPAADPTGTIAGDTPECNSTELIYSAPSATTYWQTSPNGHSIANPTTSPLEVTISGTYYVRFFDGTCWSANSIAYPVVINYSSSIDVQPSDKLAVVGDTVVFSVTASDVTSYQWQESADGITWTNVGTNSSTFTLTNVQLSRNGYKYRVILTSAACGTLTSDIATLHIYNSNCIDESFATTGIPSGWTNGGTASENLPIHYQSAPYSKALGTGDTLLTPTVDNPEVLQFYQDASSPGNGNSATVEYRIGAGAYVPFYTFVVTEAGKVETVSLNNLSGVDLRTKTNVRFRFRSTFNTWYLDDVKVFCTPCVNSASVATALPTSGPEGTYVTINGSDFTAATTVKFNGIAAIIDSWTATQLVVIVPTGAVDGNILITTTGICESVIPFDVIDKDGSACQSTFNGNDLFIYEIFDEDSNANGPPIDYGNGGMITILNPTLQTINLSNYKLYRSGTVGSQPYTVWHSPTGTLAPGELLRIKVDASKCTGYVSPFDTVIIGFNADDGFELRKLNPANSTYENIDEVLMPNYVGYYYLRDLNAAKPSAVYNPSDWTITNIWDPPSNTTTCVPVGITPPFSGSLPIINSFTTPASSCDTASIAVNASEGYNESSPADAKQLNFEWYYHNGVTDVWTLITTGGDYTITNTINNATGIGSSTLDVTNVFDKVDYQYYCRVRENDATCYVASIATKLNVSRSIWNGSAWLPSAPSINSIAIIDADFDTSIGGLQNSFSACQLIVNPSRTLTISDNKYVEVQNNVIVNGEIIVSDKGSFVQINDAGTVTGEVLTDPTRIKVEKETAVLNNWFEYTYWSSPVANETIGVGLSDAHPNRRFWFNAQNFLDALQETGNNNTLVPGHDDIDDNGDDWTLAAAGMTMSPGVGYAATHRNIGFVAGLHYKYTFSGAFNNGVYTVPVYRNDAETGDNNWNFIGNPYPSAISANSFLAENTLFDLNGPGGPMTGAIFLWSQNTNPSGSTNGNENLNFAQSDYAIINGSGQTAGGDGIVPTRYIPSGQGFFVAMANTAPSTSAGGTIRKANVTFNNSMRVKTNNDQFFRTSENGMVDNRLWINLTSNSGVFNQILVAYVPGATDGDDGMYYDATKNLSSGANTIIYTLVDSETDLKLAIQGKSPNSLNIEERIALGFYTSITEPTNFRLSIANLEGDFLTTNTIYLVDHLMNLTFNLSAGDYIFSSEKGEFNERFEIVFREQALSVIDNELPLSGLSIIELPNGEVKFTVGNNLNIQKVEIMDMLGRTLYQLKGNHSSEVYDLSNLSQAAYMAKVTLSNGQVLVKKAVKQR